MRVPRGSANRRDHRPGRLRDRRAECLGAGNRCYRPAARSASPGSEPDLGAYLPCRHEAKANPFDYVERLRQREGTPTMWMLIVAFVLVALILDFFAMEKQGAHW
jgi:hypothetical protein